MSLDLMVWAFKQDVDPPAKLVLLALADHANGETGLCIPGQKSLAAQCSMSVRTVQRHLQTLESSGLIRREPRMRGEGRGRTSDRYYLRDQGDKSGPMRQKDMTKATNQDDQHDTVGVAEPEENRKKEPIAATSKEKAPPKRDELFEAIAAACNIDWTELTRTGRGQLNAAAKELRDIGVTPEQVQPKAIAYRKRYPEAQLTPNALVKHWAGLQGGQVRRPNGRPQCDYCHQHLDDHDPQVCRDLGGFR